MCVCLISHCAFHFFPYTLFQKYYNPVLSSQRILRNGADAASRTGPAAESCPEKGPWESTSSHQTFLGLVHTESDIDNLFATLQDSYAALTKKFVGDMGAESRLFSSGALEFPKSADGDQLLNTTSLKIGVKLGGAIGCTMIILMKKYLLTSIDLKDTYDHPGNNIFAAYAAYLLFRLTWLLNVSVWSSSSIQYIHYFKFRAINAQTLRILNEVLTEVVLFLVLFALFAESLNENSPLARTVNPGYISLATLIALMIKVVYHLIATYGKKRADRGIFNLSILLRCLLTPYYPATFRDIVAANVLTSFSRPVSDFLRGSCWLLSGQVFSSDRSTTMEDVTFCEDRSFFMFIVSIQIFFGWIRMMQCLRGVRDAKWKLYPLGINAFKYFFGIVVKMYLIVAPSQTLSVGYLCMLAANALFRWCWDVVMDWGLGACSLSATGSIDFSAPWGYPPDSELGLLQVALEHDVPSARRAESWASPPLSFSDPPPLSFSTHTPSPPEPTKLGCEYFLLRPNLFLCAQNPFVYHVAICVDLILRLLSAFSFLPQSKLVKVLGSELSFYLGCLEILRRAMWMTFRVEWEHIKFVALYNERKEQLTADKETKSVLHKLG